MKINRLFMALCITGIVVFATVLFFGAAHTLGLTPPPIIQPFIDTREVSLIAVGDIMLSRGVADKINQHGVDYPFNETKNILRSADITFGNLETPITKGRRIATHEMVFRADKKVTKALAKAGFDVLSLANNHSMNFGEKGIKDTNKYLDEVGIKYAGAGAHATDAMKPAYIEHDNLLIAFLAYTDSDVVPAHYQATNYRAGTMFMDKNIAEIAIQETKKYADIVIVSMHSGTEYTHNPNHRQTRFAKAAIDAGADLVIGHHPHVVQPVEKYKDKYIIYSLGNFVFDQMWSRKTREGVIAKIILGSKGVKTIDFVPILIHDYAQPRIISGEDGWSVLSKMYR